MKIELLDKMPFGKVPLGHSFSPLDNPKSIYKKCCLSKNAYLYRCSGIDELTHIVHEFDDLQEVIKTDKNRHIPYKNLEIGDPFEFLIPNVEDIYIKANDYIIRIKDWTSCPIPASDVIIRKLNGAIRIFYEGNS